MKLKLEFDSWSDYEDERGYSSSSSEKIVPLKVGVVEECPHFMVTEIKDNSVMVAKKDGEHVSLGTYSSWPSDLHAAGYGKPEKLVVGGKGISVSSGYTYNGNSHGSSQTIYLID